MSRSSTDLDRAIAVYNLVLAEVWLKLESCQLVGLAAMSIEQQAIGSKESRISLYLIIYLIMLYLIHEET